VDGKAELVGDFFADTAVAGKLKAGDLTLAQRFRCRRTTFVKTAGPS